MNFQILFNKIEIFYNQLLRSILHTYLIIIFILIESDIIKINLYNNT